MKKAVHFYDALFDISQVNKVHNEGRMTLWVGDGFMFALAEPFDGKEATAGNGTMVGLNLAAEEEVDRLHEKALSLGGVTEGEPKIRSGRYSAYFRDLDGNKVCLFK